MEESLSTYPQGTQRGMKIEVSEYGNGILYAPIRREFLKGKTTYGVVNVSGSKRLRNYHRVLKNGRNLTNQDYLQWQYDIMDRLYGVASKVEEQSAITPFIVGRR